MDYTREILVGVCCFIAISAIHIHFVTQISFISEVKIISDLNNGKYNGVIRTNLLLFSALGMCHLIAIFVWAGFLLLFGLIPSFIDSLLFSGSCYTTLGYMGDKLPVGWRLLSLFIAISGLFSFSVSTAVLLSKTNKFKEAWKLKHQQKIIRYLKKHRLTESHFDNL